MYSIPFIWESKIVSTIVSVIEPIYIKSICGGIGEVYGMTGNYAKNRKEIYSREKNANGDFDRIWERLDYIIKLMREEALKLGAEFKVVILPVAVDDKNSLGKFSQFDDADLSIDTVTDKIEGIAKDNEVGVIYPYKEFFEAKRRGVVLRSKEGHFGPGGNRILANSILQDISEKRGEEYRY